MLRAVDADARLVIAVFGVVEPRVASCSTGASSVPAAR